MDRIHVPGYELLYELGSGSMSTVYAARDIRDDAVRAVKVLRPDFPDEGTALELMRREARIGLKARHPRVIRIVDANVTRPPYFVAMELLPGESLRPHLDRTVTLKSDDALRLASETAEGLATLHGLGFVHGDVKPENVRLVDGRGAVLIDLGFAHRPGENDAFIRRGYVFGTPNYLAPELCRRGPIDTPAADVFGLGVTLFEMLTGELPYPAGSTAAVMRSHQREEPADLRDHGDEWPAGLAPFVSRLMAKDPTERPTANEVFSTLVTPSRPLRRAS